MGKRNSKRVLLVEDERSLIAMYTLAFQHTEFDFAVVRNAEDTFEIIKKKKPDIILLDIFIPSSSQESLDFSKRAGLDLLEALRKDKNFSSVPVLVLTNLDTSADKLRAQQLGVSDYILKTNILPRQVVERVREILESS